MKPKLYEYTLEDAGKDAANLFFYDNSVHKICFFKIVIKYVRCSLRARDGIDLFSFQNETEWIQLCNQILQEHKNLDNDMALIVISHQLSLTATALHNRKGY